MAKHGKQKIVGLSYVSRVEDIVRIYDEHARSGLSNREILRRYIWAQVPHLREDVLQHHQRQCRPARHPQDSRREPAAGTVLSERTALLIVSR